ncbi:MAG TPA: YfiR family protein [Burkholderiaceae bacterium]|jgi:hypothetical protein
MIQRLLGLALIACFSPVCLAQGEARSAVASDELIGILAGIVHYTRWPETPALLHVCVDTRDELASGAGARRLADALATLGPAPVSIESRRLETGAASLSDCQALYVSDLAPAAWQRLLKELVNRPVLTIGYGEEFCSWGGQFCLERAAPGTTTDLRIRANLDAISRSGLRVNPQLLRLTQRDPKAPR